MAGATGINADTAAAPAACASNAHFWYRLQPPGPYIDCQRDNRAFGREEQSLVLSEDNGRTWPHRLAFPDAQRLTFSHVLKNGNVLFASGTKLYLSTDNLKTYKPVPVKDIHGADYLPHTPQKAENPGWYFHTLSGVLSWEIGGKELLVWGNYCNVLGDASLAVLRKFATALPGYRHKGFSRLLSRPDLQGHWRPVVGRQQNGRPQRFQLGNRRVSAGGRSSASSVAACAANVHAEWPKGPANSQDLRPAGIMGCGGINRFRPGLVRPAMRGTHPGFGIISR